jgi:hypothetical protein
MHTVNGTSIKGMAGSLNSSSTYSHVTLSFILARPDRTSFELACSSGVFNVARLHGTNEYAPPQFSQFNYSSTTETVE